MVHCVWPRIFVTMGIDTVGVRVCVCVSSMHHFLCVYVGNNQKYH